MTWRFARCTYCNLLCPCCGPVPTCVSNACQNADSDAVMAEAMRNASLPEWVVLLRADRDAGLSTTQLGAKYGVSTDTAWAVAINRTYRRAS